MKKLRYTLFALSLYAHTAIAQNLIGKVTDMDSAKTALFQAEVDQKQGSEWIASYKTYFDGTYRITVKPGQTYQLKFSYPGRTDTTVTISVDKHGTLYSGSLFVSLRKDGLRLAGFILDRVQDIPIKEVSIILKNVMTRKEDKYYTDENGYYNLKMDYETNYVLRVDKMSPGIINKYEDTSFNISTIGFNRPLDFKLDIKLGPTNGYQAPRPEYDPRSTPRNKNLKPALQVLGVRDSLKRHQQDSVMAALSKKLNSKDSVIASLNKRIKDIAATGNVDQPVANKDDDLKKMEAARKQKALESAEADLKAKQEAEKALQDKLDKSRKAAEDYKKEQELMAQERAAKAQAASDQAKLKEELDEKNRKEEEERQRKANEEVERLVKEAEAINRSRLEKRKHTLDSLAQIEGQKAEAQAELEKMEKARKDKELADKLQLEKQQKEDAARKEKEDKQAKEAKDRAASELAQLKKAREDKEAADAAKAQLEARKKEEKITSDLQAMKKAREEAEAKLITEKREREAEEKASKKESKRVAKELAEQNKQKKQAADETVSKTADLQRRAARKAQTEQEQKELESRKAMEEQEKNNLAQQLEGMRKEEQVRVVKDRETKEQEYNPGQALKANNTKNTIGSWEDRKRAKSDASSQAVDLSDTWSAGNKLIHARGYVKNGQTEDVIPNVSVNIRRLNSIVSQEVTSDAKGQYDILVDSGYFYLVSFYKDKYEISKQILDLTSYQKGEYTMVIEYLKEQDDFDPNAKMPVIQFEKNISKLPGGVWGDLETIVKMMKEIPELKIKLYGLASLDEDYPMELSVTRARLVADMILESGIKPGRIRINGLGAYRPRSGCTEGKLCPDSMYRLDRVVMYKVVKE